VAEALLRWLLPRGDLGLSILGDLRQEFEEIHLTSASRFPRLWYWRSAVALGCRYIVDGSRRFPRNLAINRRLDRTMIATLLSDLRISFRMLVKTPSVSVIAILTIGLGVAICTHSFSSVYGSILRGLPVPDDNRLMLIDANRQDLGAESLEMSIHDFLDLRENQTSFEDVAAFYQGTANLAGDEGPPERYAGAFVSANALQHLAVPPLFGRLFLQDEDRPGARPVAVLAYHVWQNRFGGDPSMLGTVVRVNGQATEIVGVMPPGFRFPFNEDLWLPHRIDPDAFPRGGGRHVEAFGKLREGVSIDVARDEFAAIAGELARRFPESNANLGFGIQRFELRYMPSEIRAVMWVMLASTFGVLLVACANVANLLLARAASRTKEVAIRTALGASRFRVARQLAVESAVLALLGGLFGLVIAWWGVVVMNQAQAGIPKPFWIDVRVGLPALLFTVAVTMAASLAAGLLPALRASGIDVDATLKDEARGSSNIKLGWSSSALVVAEVAVSCALLIGAGFLIKSVVNLRNVELGFETQGVLTGRIALPEADYTDGRSRDQFFNLLKERLEQEPGVASVAVGTHLPALGSFLYYVGVEGESYATDRDYPAAYATSISSDYFRTFEVQFLEGRDFSSLEARVGGDPVTIVNESFVDRFFPDGDVLGRRIRWGISTSTEPWLTIVGVVPDMHVGGGVGGLGNDRKRPERFYLPKGLLDHSLYAVAVRSGGPPEALASRLREVVAELDANLPVFGVASLDDAIQQATWAFGMFGILFTIFGGAALFMAAVGLYGVLAFSVRQRQLEMGIRMALGQERGSIMRLILKKGVGQLSSGVAGGLAVGALMGGPMRYVLYGVEKGDISVYVSVVVTLMVTGIFACLIPARAATTADPVDAMRRA
jgi:predicted permease